MVGTEGIPDVSWHLGNRGRKWEKRISSHGLAGNCKRPKTGLFATVKINLLPSGLFVTIRKLLRPKTGLLATIKNHEVY